SSGSWEIRKAAIHSLALAGKDEEKGPDPRAMAALLDVLRSETSAKVRLAAVMAIGSMGKPKVALTQQRVIDALKKELRARDQTIVVWANVGLMVQDRLSEAYLEAVLSSLKTGDVPTRAQAARALGMVAPQVKKELAAKDMKEVIN